MSAAQIVLPAMIGSARNASPFPPVCLAWESDFLLGALKVQPSTREVLRDGWTDSLEPRVMQVLVALHRADGAVVSRDMLIARCWGGRIVGDDAINRAIGQLRRLSRTDQGASFVIETVPRTGYRLRTGRARWSLREALRRLFQR